jgi:preprotein translocase subunit SecE
VARSTVKFEVGDSKAVSEMAQAAKFNKEQEANNENVSGFALMEPVGKASLQWKRLVLFFHDVRVEMRKVNWPSRADVISTTIVVTLTVTFFGIYFFFTDSIFTKLIGGLMAYAKKF